MIDPSAGSTDGVRQRNLSRLLRLVHLTGPLSRASITEATGLNRSTVADLIAQLSGAGLVLERAPDPARRVGRPSPVVAVDPRVVAIAVNPEVDAIEIAAVRLDQSIPLRERIACATPPSPAQTAELVAERVARWRANELATSRVVAIALAVPGLVRAADGLVRDAPHLGWHDTAVGDAVQAATGLPVSVGNDASLGVLAEHLYGAARDVDDVVYLNGGASGIGGGVIVQGVPVGGAAGYAGEFGQNRPGISSSADRRAPDGVLEDEVSRARLWRVLGRIDGDDDELSAAIAASADAVVAGEVARQRRILATAIANAVNVLNPAVVVLGGFLATLVESAPEAFTEEIRAQAMPACAEHLRVRSASLARDRLLIGAGELAFTELLRSPAT